MSVYRVLGGRPLEGTVAIHGAKNSVLPLLAASILAPGVSVLRNCPDLSDLRASIAILRHLGCTVTQTGHTVTVDATELTRWDIPDHMMRAMRSSVIFLGAVLARTGRAAMSYPGGCELGSRPIDLHLAALRKLGARVDESGGRLLCSAPEPKGADITLALPSVGATENAMLCAMGAQGVTTIVNAAREPEIMDLQEFLNSMGGHVRGAGSSVVTVRGGRTLHGGTKTVMGDRIVCATYLSAVAAAGGRAEFTGVDYRHLSTVTAVLSEAGCTIRSHKDSVTISRDPDRPMGRVSPIRTAPYPGFPTDAQAPVMAAFANSFGTTLFVENMFDARYRHVDELARMGADIRVEGRVAAVTGIPRLHGAAVEATDLRGGAALVTAALGAEGETVVSGLGHIDRGYEDLAADLTALGARIRRED